MDVLKDYAYIWETDRDKYVLLNDDFGNSILAIGGDEIKFLLIEDDALLDMVVEKMQERGNKVYGSIAELQEALNSK